MIARLRGSLVAREGSRAVIDVRDVGYAIHAPNKDLDAWTAAGGELEVFVSTDVREDAITLYGFQSDTERVAFERLRMVNGVGPKVALASLDTLGLDALVGAVESDDKRALCRIPGVGKKLADRMALELKSKLPATFTPVAPGAVAAPKPAAADPLDLALARLGYTRTEIKAARAALLADGLTPEAPVSERLRASLKILSGS